MKSIPAEETVFIDDAVRNLDGAAAFGYYTDPDRGQSGFGRGNRLSEDT